MKQIDLMYSSQQKDVLKQRILHRIDSVIESGAFINGSYVQEFEGLAAEYCGAKYAIGCANGTDALTIALMSIDLRPQEVVFTPSFTFVATAESIALLGGVPYFVDVRKDSYNIDPACLRRSIEDAKSKGLKMRAIISVDIFGNPCDYEEVAAIAKEYGLSFISDAAQSFGSSYRDQKIGSLADITTTSFFPTKPLGCYGDGGMIFTDNEERAKVIRSICWHGKGDDKYHNVRIGMNSRLDTIQAAVLIEKIALFDGELHTRQELAQYYNEQLNVAGVILPEIVDVKKSAWGVYTLRHAQRDEIVRRLQEAKVPSNVYYPIPLHMQEAYLSGYKIDSLPVASQLVKEVFCLPMHAYVDVEQREYIVDTLKNILKSL